MKFFRLIAEIFCCVSFAFFVVTVVVYGFDPAVDLVQWAVSFLNPILRVAK
jgi:hypothetical protein